MSRFQILLTLSTCGHGRYVKAGAKIDLETRDSRTALSVASASGQVEAVAELLTQCAYVVGRCRLTSG